MGLVTFLPKKEFHETQEKVEDDRRAKLNFFPGKFRRPPT
jgi:hypothetical protein